MSNVELSTVELRFAALPGHVRTARMIANSVAQRAGVPSGALDEIRLAVGEACLRAVTVNQRRASEDPIEVRMTSTGGAFTVTVTDSGEPGDDVAPGPDGGLLGAPALLAVGTTAAFTANSDPGTGAALPPGLGLALIEGLVDDLQIRRRPDGVGTAVTMTWDTAAFIDPGMATAGRP